MRAGFNRSHDILPERFYNEPIEDGPAKGQTSRADEMLNDYYKLRGWDEEGRPGNELSESL
jgi:aldehyde:ferredoxin oxidoreductase